MVRMVSRGNWISGPSIQEVHPNTSTNDAQANIIVADLSNHGRGRALHGSLWLGSENEVLISHPKAILILISVPAAEPWEYDSYTTSSMTWLVKVLVIVSEYIGPGLLDEALFVVLGNPIGFTDVIRLLGQISTGTGFFLEQIQCDCSTRDGLSNE